jgi:hypothetical protein
MGSIILPLFQVRVRRLLSVAGGDVHFVPGELRLVGVADLVEFHPDPAGGPDIPFPVEYKRGTGPSPNAGLPLPLQ